MFCSRMSRRSVSCLLETFGPKARLSYIVHAIPRATDCQPTTVLRGDMKVLVTRKFMRSRRREDTKSGSATTHSCCIAFTGEEAETF